MTIDKATADRRTARAERAAEFKQNATTQTSAGMEPPAPTDGPSVDQIREARRARRA